jgi:hypothetical protein
LTFLRVARLVRGEPVHITVLNRRAEPTSIHWHGIELDSYFDGVSGRSDPQRSCSRRGCATAHLMAQASRLGSSHG